MARVIRSGLAVDERLASFVETDALPGTGVQPDAFWSRLAGAQATIGARIRDALAKRERLQAAIDDWHRARQGQRHDAEAYRAYLAEIGYLVPEGPDFEIETYRDGPRDRHHFGPATGGAGDERALCAERGQCALGQSV